MRTYLLSFFLAAMALADPETILNIEADGTHLAPGRPAARSLIYAVAGKPLEIRWVAVNSEATLAVKAERLTGTRRIAAASGETTASEEGRVWTWEPPAARGPARYEVRLDGHPALTVRIETRDADWIQATKSALSRMTWEAAGFTPEEKNALADLGLKITQARDHSKEAPALLRMIPQDASAGRREIVWDENEHDLIVWTPGTAAGDTRVRAPRWWISKEALATDQGLIRFIDLLSEPPTNP